MKQLLIILSLLATVSCTHDDGVTLPSNCIKSKVEAEDGYEYVYKCNQDA